MEASNVSKQTFFVIKNQDLAHHVEKLIEHHQEILIKGKVVDNKSRRVSSQGSQNKSQDNQNNQNNRNNQLNDSSTNQKPPPYCVECDKTFSTRGALRKHTRNFHNADGVEKSLCHFCGKSFLRHVISTHEKVCQTKEWCQRRRQDCPLDNCNASFFRKEELINHMKRTHNMSLEPMQTLNFKNEQEFKDWKEEVEDRTFSFYSKQSGLKRKTNTYYCQQEGTNKLHRRRDDTKALTRQNKKGRIKSGKSCTSFIRARFEDNVVVVNYWPTHCHPVSPDDVKHHPLTERTMKFVREQISLNVPARQIQAAVKKRISESPTGRRRDIHISVKRINNLARRMPNFKPKVHIDATEPFNMYIEVLCAQEESPVILYQPPSENFSICPNQEDHLYFLGLQTVDQQQMLQRDSAMPLFIGCTKSDFTFNYYLITLAVPCENNFEYPVGHLITSQLNEEVVTIFLQAIGERCPELSVNCIVSDDFPAINRAVRSVFGADGPFFLSKWHFLECVKSSLLSSVPSKQVEELFDFIVAMADAETEERLDFLYDSFKEQFESKFPSVLSDFAELFSRRSGWSSCFRQFPDMIDSSLYIDTFLNKINKSYRRRPKKILNLLVELLLIKQENYKEKRENRLVEDVSDELMREQHNIAIDIPSDLVRETLLHHWTVQSSKHGQEFVVMKCLSKCSGEDCLLKCKDCVYLCSHMYLCTCGKNDFICAHVQKVFMDYGSLSDTESNCGNAACEVNNDSLEDVSDVGLESAKVVVVDSVTNASYEDTCASSTQDEVDDHNYLAKVAEQTVSMERRKFSILKNLEAIRQSVKRGILSDNMLGVIDDTLQNMLVDCNFLNSSDFSFVTEK